MLCTSSISPSLFSLFSECFLSLFSSGPLSLAVELVSSDPDCRLTNKSYSQLTGLALLGLVGLLVYGTPYMTKRQNQNARKAS